MLSTNEKLTLGAAWLHKQLVDVGFSICHSDDGNFWWNHSLSSIIGS
ncbi:hypothetical protein [Coleofasciculus sp. E2-BRE-01]